MLLCVDFVAMRRLCCYASEWNQQHPHVRDETDKLRLDGSLTTQMLNKQILQAVYSTGESRGCL